MAFPGNDVNLATQFVFPFEVKGRRRLFMHAYRQINIHFTCYLIVFFSVTLFLSQYRLEKRDACGFSIVHDNTAGQIAGVMEGVRERIQEKEESVEEVLYSSLRDFFNRRDDDDEDDNEDDAYRRRARKRSLNGEAEELEALIAEEEEELTTCKVTVLSHILFVSLHCLFPPSLLIH